MNSCFEVDSDEAFEVVEEFYPVEASQAINSQKGYAQNGIATHDVSSIEQGLRQSVTAVE